MLSSIELDLPNLKDKKLSNKEIKQFITSNVDIEKIGLSKLPNHKEFKIYLVKSYRSVIDYMIIGINKGLLILRFDNSITPSIEINLIGTSPRNLRYIFTSVIDGVKWKEFLVKGDFSYLKLKSTQAATGTSSVSSKKEVEAAVSSSTVTTNCLDNKISFSYFQRLKILPCPLQAKSVSYTAFIDYPSGIYTIYGRKPKSDKADISLSKVKSGNSLDFVWCPFDYIFAISKTANVTSYSVQVYYLNVETSSTDLIYGIDNCISSKVYASHFLIIPSFDKQTSRYELHFYCWNDKVKTQSMTVKSLPNSILTSSNTEYSIFIFSKYYQAYRIKPVLEDAENQTMQLELTHEIYIAVQNSLLYEDFTLFFISENGIYFHILSDVSTYPIKILKASNSQVLLNSKLTKVEKPNLCPSIKLLGLIETKLISVLSNGYVSVVELDHILIRVMTYLKEKKINLLQINALPLLEKKYIKTYISILNHYFSHSEEVIKRLFVSKLDLTKFKLYNYLNFFMYDFTVLSALPQDVQLSNKLLRTEAINSLLNKDLESLLKLYSFTSGHSL